MTERVRMMIFGAGAHARAIADFVSEDPARAVVGFSDSNEARRGSMVVGVPVLGDDTAALAAFQRGDFDCAIVGIGNTDLSARQRVFDRLRQNNVPTPALVHPKAVVARSATFGPGTVVFAGAIVGARAQIGANVVIYSGSVVEHDCRIEDHAYLSPGVVLAGNVTVHEGAFIGAGATVLPEIHIGRDAVIAAGAVVINNVADGETVIGSPARPRTGSQ